MIDYRIGDVRDVIAAIPDGTIGLVASSPPFLALRSYLPDGHDAKHAEIGSEPDPATFIDTLLALTAEWGRVLAPWGSIAIELGDTYAGSGGAGGDYNVGGLRDGQGKAGGSGRLARHSDQRGNPDGMRDQSFQGGNTRTGSGPGWPRAKSLALIPQLYATSLAYGRNLLTGQPSPAGQWLVRNVIVWHRPNPAVGALGDKVRPSTSYITVATRSSRRWFDLDAVRGEPSPNTHARLARGIDVAPRSGKSAERDGNFATMPALATTAGAPPLDCWFDEHDTWTITTQPSSLAHYAMWPAKLAERLILMMCPAEVCSTCGEPRRRITERTPEYAAVRAAVGDFTNAAHREMGSMTGSRAAQLGKMTSAENVTVGWSDCGHDAYRAGTVLDPFAGTGTTLAAADFHGRDAIGIDLDARNRDLYPARREEVARALNPTHVRTIDGQMDMFGEVG